MSGARSVSRITITTAPVRVCRASVLRRLSRSSLGPTLLILNTAAPGGAGHGRAARALSARRTAYTVRGVAMSARGRVAAAVERYTSIVKIDGKKPARFTRGFLLFYRPAKARDRMRRASDASQRIRKSWIIVPMTPRFDPRTLPNIERIMSSSEPPLSPGTC